MLILDSNIDLPEWLLIEVLLRLPPASLCRFKAVSKEWHSMISSTYFIRTYASRASTSPPCWTFLSAIEHYDWPKRSGVREHKLLMDLHIGDLKWPSPISDQPIDHNLLTPFYRVLGVSNGLVLYWCSVYNFKDSKYSSHRSVCNLVTKQCVVLPPCIRISYETSGWGFLTEMRDGIVTSYTVVMYVARHEFGVFFSKTGEWNFYTTEIDPFYVRGSSTELDGILHWLHPTNGIVAYDPHRNPKALRVIALPRPPSVYGRMTICCTHQGHLRYLDSDAESLSIWVLNDYGFGDNWLLQHRADYVDIYRDVHHSINRLKITMTLQIISFHPFDPDIVYFGCDFVFISYNMRERKSQVLKSFRTPKLKKASRYRWLRAFTLVIPPFPVFLPSSPPRE